MRWRGANVFSWTCPARTAVSSSSSSAKSGTCLSTSGLQATNNLPSWAIGARRFYKTGWNARSDEMRASLGSVARGQAGGDAGLSIMMGGTDVLGFPMTPSSENSQEFIETIDDPGLIVEIHPDVNRDG